MYSADAPDEGQQDAGEMTVQIELHHGAHGSIQVLSINGDRGLQGIQGLRPRLPLDLSVVLTPRGANRRLVASSTGEGAQGAGTTPSNVTGRGTAPAPLHLVVLDLSGVAFMDSVGIGLLVALHRHLESAGRSFAVCCLQEQPRRVLALTGVDTLLAVHSHLSQALTSRANAALSTSEQDLSPETAGA